MQEPASLKIPVGTLPGTVRRRSGMHPRERRGSSCQGGLEPSLEGGDGAVVFHHPPLQLLAGMGQHPRAKRTPWERARHPLCKAILIQRRGGLEIVSHQALTDLSSPFLSLIIPPLGGRY